MSDVVVFEETVGEDGRLVLHMPPDAPHGRVRVTVEAVPETKSYEPEDPNDPWYDEELERLLTDEALKGQGLSSAEIARSSAIGIWADREDMKDSVAWVNEQRRKYREKRQQDWHRD
jgi:hypothetical protein